MRFHYHLLPHLPMLSWLAVVELDGAEVVVYHGAAVEVRDGFFIEGGWNGDFCEGDFATTGCVFGTGATLAKGSLTFVSSTATTDYLYYQHLHRSLIVSNSLPFVLAHTLDQLDPHCDYYDRVNASIALGIDQYVPEIPTANGTIRRLLWRNLAVDGHTVTEEAKTMPPSFNSFAEYHSFLDQNYASIALNLRDGARLLPLGIYSTQSKGYDTTAVNAIAGKYGIDGVFTVSKGKASGCFEDSDAAYQVDDDGTDICKALGLRPVISLDRRAFEHAPHLEYLFYATLDDNQDANFAGLVQHLTGPAVLLTGTLGELWYPDWPFYARDFPRLRGPHLGRGDLGTHSLTEFRLSVGFVHLPLIYLGACNREDIRRITASEEMTPWSIDGEYNRPIPRRLGEEAGVPRETFGQKKMASVVEFTMPRIPFGESLLAEYRQFLVNNRILRPWFWHFVPIIRKINTIVVFSHSKRMRGIYYLERLISKLLHRTYTLPQLGRALNGRIFCFCANKRAGDYASALRGKSNL